MVKKYIGYRLMQKRSKLKKIKSEQGYSLVELIVAIQILAIVITMIYSVYLIGYRYFGKWDRQNDLQNLTILIHKVLDRELHSLHRISKITSKQMEYFSDSTKKNSLKWTEENIYLNNRKLAKNDIKVSEPEILFFIEDAQGQILIKKFSEMDIKVDGIISEPETHRLRALRITFNIYHHNLATHFSQSYNLVKLKQRYLLLRK